MNGSNLKLVSSAQIEDAGDTAGLEAIGDQSTPAGRLFARWVWMMGKNPKRCALGPKRAKVMADALKLYDEETLALAIDGCAASAWHAGANDRGREFNDLELIFRDEAHIERFAGEGEALRERVQRDMDRGPEAPDTGPVQPSTAVLLRLRDTAAGIRARAGR